LKRTAFHRRTPLARAPFKRRAKPMRQRARKVRDRGERSDPLYLAWLRTRPCRVHGCRGESCPHHLRHTATGAAMGAKVKDDRRAISLCHDDHMFLHNEPWALRAILGVDDLRGWENEQLAVQRAEYLRAHVEASIPL
jgi:hypothetical protein